MAKIIQDYLCYTENHLRVLHKCYVATQSIKNGFQPPTQVGVYYDRDTEGARYFIL